MAVPLETTISRTGVQQSDMVKFLENVRDLVNELRADHATFKTIIDELDTDYTALLADVTAIRTALVATHAKLDADTGITDTDYAATNDPAALTATAIAATNPATLTNNTDLTLNKG